MTLLIIYVLIALSVSFACSVMEAVLLSITPAHVALAESERHKMAPQLRKLKDDIERPLIAILTLNTIANTAGAAGAGAQAVSIWGDTVLGIFSGILTFLILVLSEIVPKTLGAVYWKQLTPIVARMLAWIIWLLFPVVWLMELLTKLLSRGRGSHSVSRAEMSALAQLGVREGTIDPGESQILSNLFRFSSVRAADAMTPRTVMFRLPEATTVGAMLDDHPDNTFSRIPVFRDKVDEMSGYVLKDHVLLAAARGDRDGTLESFRRPLQIVPASAPLPNVLETMLASREHIALVVDEYGGTAGIITMEDVVETLLGVEIVDELDSVEDMQALARKAWKSRAEKMDVVVAPTDDSSSEMSVKVERPTRSDSDRDQ
ncbi:MAG: hemolysin family protein [Myxococcota bacterium]